MFKYTSASSAIKIIKSGKILLNNPTRFNDPFDCDIFMNYDELIKINSTVYNYVAFKFICENINDGKIHLNNGQKRLLNVINNKMKKTKKELEKKLYYTEIPELNSFLTIILKSKKELRTKLKIEEEKFKYKLNKITEDLKANMLVSCFSKRNDSILMWSHYADNHRGVCLEYEMPLDEEFRDVIYTDKRPMINYKNYILTYLAHDILKKEMDINNFPFKSELLEPFYTKSLDWEYEQEVRCVCSDKNIEKNKRLSFNGEYYFIELGLIKKIYIGSKAGGNDIDEIIELAKHRNIEIVFMKESKEEYKIEIDINHKYVKSEKKKEETNGLLRLIDEIKKNLEKESYISAFSLALNIPAICGSKIYPNLNKEEQYKTWVNNNYIKGLKDEDKMPYPSSNLLYDIREEYYNHATFNVRNKYAEFDIDQFILRVESKKPFDIYLSQANMVGGYGRKDKYSYSLNVREFCGEMIELGKSFYKENQMLFNDLDNILIEDYDKKKDEYNELKVLQNRGV